MFPHVDLVSSGLACQILDLLVGVSGGCLGWCYCCVCGFVCVYLCVCVCVHMDMWECMCIYITIFDAGKCLRACMRVWVRCFCVCVVV